MHQLCENSKTDVVGVCCYYMRTDDKQAKLRTRCFNMAEEQDADCD